MEGITRNPWQAYKLLRRTPNIPVKHEHLRYYAKSLGKQIARFAWACEMALLKHREGIMHRQFIQARLGDIATELYMASCVYSRLTSLMVNGTIPEPEKQLELKTGRLYMQYARSRNQRRFDSLKTNFDDEVVAVADGWLGYDYQGDENWVLIPAE